MGAGYVGLVTAACFAEMGNNVTCVDINKDKVDEIQKGKMPTYEPDLSELVKGNLAAGGYVFVVN